MPDYGSNRFCTNFFRQQALAFQALDFPRHSNRRQRWRPHKSIQVHLLAHTKQLKAAVLPKFAMPALVPYFSLRQTIHCYPSPKHRDCPDELIHKIRKGFTILRNSQSPLDIHRNKVSNCGNLCVFVPDMLLACLAVWRTEMTMTVGVLFGPGPRLN